MTGETKKPKRCPALSYPELERCTLPKGHDGPHQATSARPHPEGGDRQ